MATTIKDKRTGSVLTINDDEQAKSMLELSAVYEKTTAKAAAAAKKEADK